MAKTLKIFFSGLKACGESIDNREDLIIQHQKVISENLCVNFMIAADSLHRECLLACVRDSDFVPAGQYQAVFAFDVDLLHAFCQTHPDRAGEVLYRVLYAAKLSVDVYRYIESQVPSFTKRNLLNNALGEGNTGLAKHIVASLSDVTDDDLHAMMWARDGVDVMEAIACDFDLKSSVGRVMQEIQEEYPADPVVDAEDAESATPSVLLQNIKELLRRNYICDSDVCYQIAKPN